VLRRSDLPSAPTWSGGRERPSNAPLSCPGFHPKESDLVVNGSAEAAFRSAGLVFDSTSEVYATPAMAALDWRRAYRPPASAACLRAQMTKGLPRGVTVRSFGTYALPLHGVESIAYRLVLVAPGSTVRVLSELVLTRTGRYEIDLSTTAPLDPSGRAQRSEEQSLEASEASLLRRLLARAD
jgi:hypothetical protein